MALLQALFSFLGKSAGKILNAIFGWAVVALFGRSSPKQQTLLSGLVAAAAAWPILLVGIAIPKIATFLIAFVPLSSRVPSWIVRVVWLALALAVPVVVGLVVASKAPPGTPPEPALKRVLRGFPITLGIACAFVLMFITVPALRIMSAARGRKDEHVPCITEGGDYQVVAADIDRILVERKVPVERAEPSWWLSGPSKVLQKLGGKALRGFMPDKLAYWEGDDMEIAFYPSDILIRGPNRRTAWTHGFLAESLAGSPGLQTFDPVAQDLERQIRRIWQVYRENPTAHEKARGLLSRLRDVIGDLGTVKVDYDDWQVLYRQTLQLERALHGQPQLLESTTSRREAKMKTEDKVKVPGIATAAPAAASTGELVSELFKQSAELVKKEVALAKSEVLVEVKQEVKMAERLGVAAVCALCGLNLLLVAAAMALAHVLPAWAAALVVAGVVLLVGALAAWLGWGKRVKQPLERTQRTLKEDVRWAKERLA
jgi:hypothetical protein